MKKYMMSFGIATLMIAPVLAEDAKPAAPAATPAATTSVGGEKKEMKQGDKKPMMKKNKKKMQK